MAQEPLQIDAFVSDFQELLIENNWSNQKIQQTFPFDKTKEDLEHGNRQTAKQIFKTLKSLPDSYQTEKNISTDWLKEILSETQSQRVEEEEERQKQAKIQEQVRTQNQPSLDIPNLRPYQHKPSPRGIAKGGGGPK